MRSIILICALTATLQLLSSPALAAGGWTWPIRGPVLTPYRNGGDPYAGGQHRGIDIGAPVGSRVVAAVGGAVTFVGVVGSSGLTVSERTADGRFDLSYLHLSSVAVHRGDAISPGAAVGLVGVSGRRSVQAPHLHFGVREAGARDAYHDPLDFLAPPAGRHAPDPAPAPAPVRVVHPATPEPVRASHAPAMARPVAVPTAMRPHGIRLTPPAGVVKPHPHDHASPAPAQSVLRGPSPARVPAHASSTPPQAQRVAGGGHGGVNIGWLVACLGLVAAATALGRPDTTRKLAARGRARLGGLLRPASRGG
jgi:hypothetical protein